MGRNRSRAWGRAFVNRSPKAAALLVASCIALFGAAMGAGLSMSEPARAQEVRRGGSFDQWVQKFRRRALSARIPAAVFDAAFDGVTLNAAVIKADRNQAEFNRAIWEYLESAVSEERVSNGRAALVAQKEALQEIEEKYGVPKEVVVAIWGAESGFGANRGSYDVIQSVATLAYEGRRKKRFEAELLAALRILSSGDVEPRQMLGSWAGAMGHTQFMPSSYIDLAVDFDKDGKRDIWSDDPIDALASTARYLSARGWKTGEPWGLQVKVPDEFDYRLLDAGRRPTSYWAEKGIVLSGGGELPKDLEGGELFLPAGAHGPAFIVFNNFRTLLTYNSASAYALAVALLSERIGGAPSHGFGWPVAERPLSKKQREELQEKLSGLGFDTGGVDGILGPNSRAAIRRFQASQGLIADGYASELLLDFVRRAVVAREAPLLGPAEGALSEGDVREIQVFLGALGYSIGEVDGKIGTLTEKAIAHFVQGRELDLEPEASKDVLEALRRAVRGD